jgi:hypothetical protein
MSALDLLAGGLANAISSSFLNVFDSAKTRIQLDSTGKVYHSLPQALPKIYAEEGFTGLLTPGLKAGVIREMSYSSFRFGMYSPCRNFYNSLLNGDTKFGDSSLAVKFLSGVTVGLLGSSAANPTDLVKIKFATRYLIFRLQAEHGKIVDGRYTTGLRKGHTPVYQSSATIQAFVKIYKLEGGIRGLYRGVNVTAIRAGIKFYF